MQEELTANLDLKFFALNCDCLSGGKSGADLGVVRVVRSNPLN